MCHIRAFPDTGRSLVIFQSPIQDSWALEGKWPESTVYYYLPSSALMISISSAVPFATKLHRVFSADGYEILHENRLCRYILRQPSTERI